MDGKVIKMRKQVETKSLQDKKLALFSCVQSNVNLTQRTLGHFILKVMKYVKFCRSPLPLILHDRVMILSLVCAFIKLVQIGSLV